MFPSLSVLWGGGEENWERHAKGVRETGEPGTVESAEGKFAGEWKMERSTLITH